jgi:hypothetical protein
VAAYVRSTGTQDGDDAFIDNNLVTTLDQALKRCRSGQGDIVYVLPGHVESIDAADKMSSLVAGTQIIGLGSGNLRPTFTWTTATSSFLFDVANVTLANCRLIMASAANAGVEVIAPITVSAAGCAIVGNDIRFGADANDIVTDAVTTTVAADDFDFSGNYCYGVTAAAVDGSVLRLVGADNFRMHGTTIIGASVATTTGLVVMSGTASLGVDIQGCVIANYLALSVHAATGMAASTGIVKDCHFGILDTATLGGWVTSGSLQFYGCTTSNLITENSGPMTPQSTTT